MRNSLSDFSPSGVPIDLKNTSWKAFVGVRPLKWLAAELDYIDLGSGSTSVPSGFARPYSAQTSGRAYAAYAVGFLPVSLPIVEFFGKVGFAGSTFDTPFRQWDSREVAPQDSNGAKVASLSVFLSF